MPRKLDYILAVLVGALLLFVYAACAVGQVIGIEPTPIAMYNWDPVHNQFNSVTTSNTSGAFPNTPQAFTFTGFNVSLGQWVPITLTDILPPSGVTAGSYTCSNITVANTGILTAASSGSCGAVQTLTTSGGSGASTLLAGTLNIPVYQGQITLATSGTSGPATFTSNTLNIPNYSAGTVSSQSQCSLGLTGLVGALTDSGGVIKQTPLCIGNGPIGFVVGANSTQLQLGINDNKYADNTGSFTINVSKNGGTATPVTVGGTVMPWSSTTNTAYSYGQNDGASPVIALTGLVAGDTVTVTYVSGTVTCGVSTPQCPATDANGWITTPYGPSAYGGPTGTFIGPTFGAYPTFYMGPSGSTANALTGAATGGAAPGTTFDGSVARTFDYHTLGADCSLTLTTTGTSGTATLGACSGGTHALNIPQYSAGSGGSPGTPAGTVQAYKDSTHFTGTQTWVYAAGVNGGTCDHVTDETTAFNALLTTVSVAGGGVISYQCNGLFNSAEITVPVNIRITGLVPSGNGQWSTPPNLTLSQMDLRFNATDAKLVWLNVGGGEIDHMNLTDGSSDCAPFILDINTTLAIHDNLFSGTASGTSACNDAIVLGGTTTTIGNAVTDAFQGYGTYIQHNFFDKIRRGVYLRVFAQAVTVKDNTWSKTCGSTNLAAAVQIGTGTGTSDGNVFSGNLYETANYPYVIWIQANQNQFFGETFWDATGTVLKVFHFVSGVNNIGYLQGDATITYSILTDNQQPGGGNAIATASMQNGMVLAALQNRYCPDTSGSGTAQTCSTNDGTGFTPTVGTLILYHTTTSNSGTGLTINVNGLGAKSVRVPSGSGWTATLSTSPASIPGGAGTVPLIPMMYDGTQWNALATGLGTGCSLTLTTTGTSGAASLGACSGGSQTLNIPQYTGGGGGSGDYVNITGSGQVTATGCTQSAATGGNCAIVGTTTTAVTFSAIPITYQNLKLVVYGKATSGTAININATFNSDTGTNYAITGMSQTGGSNPIGSTAVSATHCLIGTLPSAIVGSTITDIPGYSDTSFVKTAISQITLTPSISVNTNNNYAVQGCAWNNTAAITSITLTIASNDYAAGTKFILYGTN